MVTLTRDKLLSLFKPCVYEFWEHTKCLYVGASTQGLSRVVSSHHRITSSLEETYTHVFLHWCSSKEEAFKLERLLIKELKPRLNSKTQMINTIARALDESKEVVKEFVRTKMKGPLE